MIQAHSNVFRITVPVHAVSQEEREDVWKLFDTNTGTGIGGATRTL